MELSHDGSDYQPYTGDFTYGGSVWDLVRKDYVEVEAFKGTIEGQSTQFVDGNRGSNVDHCVTCSSGDCSTFQNVADLTSTFKSTCAKDPDTGKYGTGGCCLTGDSD